MTDKEADERYVAPIKVAAQAIIEQNKELINRAQQSDFRPDVELSYCKNGAITLINRLFEAAASYDEGRVPFWVLMEMVETTERLLEMLKKLPNAPIEEIDKVDTAFNEAMAIFADGHEKPRMKKKTYLKQVFRKRDRFFASLRGLHEAYVRQMIVLSSKPVRKHRKRHAEIDPQKQKRASDRSDVFDEITRLRKKGLSVASSTGRCGFAAPMPRVSARFPTRPGYATTPPAQDLPAEAPPPTIKHASAIIDIVAPLSPYRMPMAQSRAISDTDRTEPCENAINEIPLRPC